MEVIESFSSAKFDEPVSLCIGVFDGVHLGHQSLLKSLKTESDNPCVITFKNHPKSWIKNTSPRLIYPFNQRLDELELNGVKTVIALEFTDDIRSLTAKRFMDHCKKMFRIKTFVSGYDTVLGSDRISDIQSLILDSKIVKVAPLLINGTLVSSQKIREEIEKHNFELVSKWLGKPYRLKLDLRERLNEETGQIFVDDLCYKPTNLVPDHLATYPFLEIELG